MSAAGQQQQQQQPPPAEGTSLAADVPAGTAVGAVGPTLEGDPNLDPDIWELQAAVLQHVRSSVTTGSDPHQALLVRTGRAWAVTSVLAVTHVLLLATANGD